MLHQATWVQILIESWFRSLGSFSYFTLFSSCQRPLWFKIPRRNAQEVTAAWKPTLGVILGLWAWHVRARSYQRATLTVPTDQLELKHKRFGRLYRILSWGAGVEPENLHFQQVTEWYCYTDHTLGHTTFKIKSVRIWDEKENANGSISTT